MNDITNTAIKIRKADHEISDFILGRWSPRAMTGDKISSEELMSLFEAARWAPSSFNNQPWRFIYAERETDEWNLLFNLLGEFNQNWCKNASVLVVVCSSTVFEYNGKPSRTHSFDTGAAWENLAVEGCSRGLVVHGMEGFDYNNAKKDLEIPDNFQVEAMIAIGKKAPRETLPEDLHDKDIPSDRKKLSEIVFKGKFKS